MWIHQYLYTGEEHDHAPERTESVVNPRRDGRPATSPGWKFGENLSQSAFSYFKMPFQMWHVNGAVVGLCQIIRKAPSRSLDRDGLLSCQTR